MLHGGVGWCRMTYDGDDDDGDTRHLDPPGQARSLTGRGWGWEARHHTHLGYHGYCILIT